MELVDGGHETVLLDEAIDALVSNPSGAYVDATFGRGGHSQKILSVLAADGTLLGLDKDPVAVSAANEKFSQDRRFSIIHGSFADLDRHLERAGLSVVDGILADLGVSSPQLDRPERGFSFLKDGPLDMRMNTQMGMTAAQWLSSAQEQEIALVLRDYGEEKFAKRIARAIVSERKLQPIVSTLQLAKVVAEANPAWEKNKHPATRTFQAIRIKINNELQELERFLSVSANSLAVGGRLVVVSFHSLEDRMVKRFMRDQAKGNTPPAGMPVFEKDIVRNYKVFSKAVKPSKEEIARNVRSRSAVMRVLEKISDA